MTKGVLIKPETFERETFSRIFKGFRARNLLKEMFDPRSCSCWETGESGSADAELQQQENDRVYILPAAAVTPVPESQASAGWLSLPLVQH